MNAAQLNLQSEYVPLYGLSRIAAHSIHMELGRNQNGKKRIVILRDETNEQ